MKYSKKFEGVQEYETYIDSSLFVTPNLDTIGPDSAAYHRPPITLLKCVYDVSNISINTVLMDNTHYQSLASINKMYVDGEEVTKAASYQFSSTGLHTVHYDINVDSQSGALPVSFNDCKALYEVTLPDKCRAFHPNSSTFQNCNKLKSVKNIHKDFNPLPYITGDDFCFSNIDYLEIDRDNPYIDSRRNCNALIDTSNGKIITGGNKVVWPGDVSAIGSWAFQGKTSTGDIILPHNIKWIGEMTFSSNPSITKVFLPSSIEHTGSRIFINCPNLTSVVIEDGIKHLGPLPFNGTNLSGHVDIPGSLEEIHSNICTETNVSSIKVHEGTKKLLYGAFTNISSVITTIDLPSTITSIGESDPTVYGYVTAQGWVFTYMPSLQSVIIRASTPPTLYGKDSGGNIVLHSNWYGSDNVIFYVPAESVNAYKAASGWSGLGSRIQAITNQ